MELVVQVKRDEASKALKANLENGLSLFKKEQQPTKDTEVWDLKLAKGYDAYPKLWTAVIADYQSSNRDKREEAVGWARELLKEKELASLRHYVQAEDHDLDDDHDLNKRVSRIGSNYLSPAFRQLQNQQLYRILKLESLATLTLSSKEFEPHKNAYDLQSLKIQDLWKKFKANSRLVKIFPTVETIQDFWRVVKSAMRFFGFQSQGKTKEDKSVVGEFPNGQGRTRRHPNKYFVGWLIRAESGPKFAREKFEVIIEAVRDRLAVERAKRKERENFTEIEPRPGRGLKTAA